MCIKVQAKGNLLESTGTSDWKESSRKAKLDETLSAALSDQLEGIVRKLQKLGTDSLGIGAYVRNSMSFKEWKALNWSEVYPEADVRVEAKVHVFDFGMIQ
ncbi:Ger(x)C family spore germination C-terminal domain-containing protein [Cohnella yongneupensis]|uniref:Ger(X)C family spore germination C-terminal domain-containing protein n=1 Tax=Cohnella yongneupensis TaxID=425006 RepID=A0ABW0QVZ1_9BACL